MFLIILSICLLITLLISYIFVIKPYRRIQSIKKSFQQKGYKVLVQTLNFNDDTITSSLEHDAAVHKDSRHRNRTTWQDFDVTIKNSFFMIYVSLNSVQLVKEAYKKMELLQKPWMLKNNYSRFYGGGLLMNDGNSWKAKRKLYSEIFNFKLLEELHPLVEKSIEISMNKWKISQKVNLLQQSRVMFFDTFVACYFGRQFDEFKYQDQSYCETVAKSFQELVVQAFSLRHILLGTKFLEKGYLKEDRIIEERMAAIKLQTKEFVKKRWEQISESQNPSESSILSKLVFNEECKNLSESDRQKALQDITGDVIMFFFAATDTTSGVLTTTMHVLNKHPQVALKLIEQINASENNLKSSTIKGWKYMDAVFNEVLRMYGPLNWISVREMISEDFTIGGVKLPKDTILGIQTQTIHSSQTFYENADQFMPQRFLVQRKQDPYTFVAFGGGQRNCIGQYLARIQFKMALAMLLKKFDFKTQDEFVMYQPSIYLPKNNLFCLKQKEN